MSQPLPDRLSNLPVRTEVAVALVVTFGLLFGTGALGRMEWLAYVAFLYVPVAVAWARRVDFATFGLLSPDAGRTTRTTLVVAAIVFPLFAGGYYLLAPVLGFPLELGFHDSRADVLRFIVVQVVLVAFAEEYFYRGYLQTRFDALWAPRWSVLGARLGPGWLVANALFAVGHLALGFHPERLATFIPGLWFGWMRARTGDIYGAVVLHGLSNILIAYLQGQIIS